MKKEGRGMRKAYFLVLFVLGMAVEGRGAAGKVKDSAETPNLVKTSKLKETDTIPDKSGSSSGFLGNLLVVPMDGSHWVGIKAIAQEMGRRGHRVTVVIPELSIRMGPGKYYDTITYPVPYGRDYMDFVMASHKDILEKSAQSLMEKIKKRFSQIQKITNLLHTTAESLLFNASLISHLAQQNFDAVLTDPMVPTGLILAHKLGIPTINLLRGVPCSLDMKASGCPSPPSYVPRFFTGFTDRMSFKQRVINTLVALLEPLFCRLMYWHFDQIAYDFLEEKVSVAELFAESAIWLLRIDFTLEFPRPLMPNVVLVGGINCKVRNPLPEDLASWLIGEHGFVVFTLGTMISQLPDDITSTFLDAFGQIPQKVIWRYTGNVSHRIPDNVKMMKWVPQNDLLAHPGVRVFITHAGSHGIFEGLCHGVPMVMVPLAAEQPDNAQKIASRGAGVMLDITALTTETLLQALNEVINDTRYKENIGKLSALHNDRPTNPLDLSVFWTEFVMQHKGAKHLRPAFHDLYWFQYHILDVMVVLATALLVFVALTSKCLTLCLRKLSRKRKRVGGVANSPFPSLSVWGKKVLKSW